MRLWYRFNQALATVVLCAVYKVRAYGRENIPSQGPVLLVSNHQSYLDPMLVGIPVPREVDYTPRESLFRNRLFGCFIQILCQSHISQ